MPAVIAHWAMEKRVRAALRARGIQLPDAALMQAGAQGPDIFYFHRILPWKFGASYAGYGLCLHRVSPRALLRACGAARRAYPEWAAEFDALTAGLLCHYALDRSAHPFVLYWQERLRQADPDYARSTHFYHYRIESALDVLSLRRETGRTIKGFPLTHALPRDRRAEEPFGLFYAFLMETLLGASVNAATASLAIRDMRDTMWWMNDPPYLKQRYLLGPMEWLWGAHVATSLMRPADVSDWDYGNEEHRPWVNPFDGVTGSTASYAELFDRAVDEAADMIAAYLEHPDTRADLTGDRGFASDLPGVYGELDGKADTEA